MLNGLKRIFFGNHDSKNAAKSRLQFVLVQDRTGLSPEEMAGFKKELIGVIQKFFMIDDKSIDINYKREGESTTLLINSPVLVRRESKKDIKAKMANGEQAVGSA